MRLALQTVICCCVFTTVLPMVKGATGDFNSSLKKRFRVWLQSRMKRDLRSGLATATEQDPETHVGPQQKGGAETLAPPSNFGLNIRSKRWTVTSAKKPGCVLVTCTVHELIYRLHLYNESGKEASAPEDKMRSTGYGRRRRRRSLPDAARLALRTGKRQRSVGAAQGGQGLKTPTAVA
ncbi:pro-adrenomedullin isoform X2 [Centroberyx affinis]|uniref:pro-adrenomedullin isoform X2 n=1 Tax=Centroberyx affinis TaxID=166261 RepID=UPI003A5C564B